MIQTSPPSLPAARGLTAFTRFLAGAVVFLLVAGAMVTSTGSGLSVPDWPLSFGQLMPPMKGGVFYEHGHRMIATAVGALTVLLALWIHRVERRAWVRRLGWTALGLVILQGLLGGATVLLRLPVWTSAAHACLAQGFFLVVVFLAMVLSPGWSERDPSLPARSRLPLLATGATVVIYLQLILGAVTRHLHAALVIPDFPLAMGGLAPSVWTPEIAVHYAHRVGAFLVFVAVIVSATSALRLPPSHASLRKPAAAMLVLVIVQILLGGSIVWTQRQVAVASAHVVVGALLLAVSLALTVRSRRFQAARGNEAAALRPSLTVAGGKVTA